MRSKLLFLSTDNLEGYTSDDALAVEPLAAKGVAVETVSWKEEIDPAAYDGAVIRSTWDYQEDLARFLATLQSLDERGLRIANPLSVVRWNVRKTYLKALQERGALIAPTIFQARLHPDELPALFAQLNAEELVIKPQVGATAGHAYRVGRDAPEPMLRALARSFESRPCLVQPFLRSVVEEGEYSLFYFAGALSHAVLKKPKPKDFRVQEEHGGQILAVPAPDPALVKTSEQVMAAVDASLLYARVDLVRTEEGFALMELELVEPSLYLRMSDTAPERFADAVVQWLCTSPRDPG